jgi:signal transduction histidine kinase/DNA-binding response OmpR family regulator
MVSAAHNGVTDQPVNILLVDDRQENLVALESVLSELGQNLVRAYSGREALKHLLHADFAVILLDVQMPEMDGFETASLIRARARSRHTPILFLTAINKDEDHVSRGYSVGAVDYVFKPFDPDVLRAKVSAFVQLSRKQQELERETEQRREAEGAVRRLNADLEQRVQERTAELRDANGELEAARRRLEFLADASINLAQSLDYDATAARVARLAVPFLADFCLVELLEEDGCLKKIAAAHRDPVKEAEITLQAYRYRPGTGVGPRTAEVLATGEARVLAARDCAHWPGDDPVLKPLAALRPTACLIVPLVARGRTLGVLALGMDEPGRTFGQGEIALAGDYARRAAAALENARLFFTIQESDRRKDEFLAMLAHELRNPLAAICYADYALAELEPPDPRVAKLRAIIGRQSQNLSRLVDDLLDISRITRGKIELRMEHLELGAMVQRAVEMTSLFIQSRQHALTVDVPAEPLWVYGDPTRIEQVLANLLHNAAKYTDPGGRIELHARAATTPEGTEQVRVTVRDNGIGIAPPLLPHIFDLFTQAERALDRSQGGLGIGLSLVRSLAQLHGGPISAHSEGVGTGSEFELCLPRVPAPEPEEEPPPPTAAPEPRTAAPRRVLIVEDNLDAAETLTEILELRGHDVRVAPDGPAGVAAAAEYRPEVVLLDIGLPGMDGFEVARRLRAQRNRPSRRRGAGDSRARSPLLIALTGYGQDEDRRRSEEAGFDLHLTKPVDPEALEKLLGTLD